MELVYLFIKDLNKIKNQNLNFGSEYIFDYSPESKILSIEKNELYIKNHYLNFKNDEASLLNITSIIGQNGTGKTSILNFIKDNFVKGKNLNVPSIFIYKNETDFVINNTEDIEVKIESIKDFQYKSKTISLKKEQLDFKGATENDYITLGYDYKGFDNTDLIYFSNVFDVPGSSNSERIYDISTNNLIVQDYKNEIENRVLNDNSSSNHILSFLNNDLERQLKFIQKFKFSNIIPFKLPDFLVITTKNNFFRNISDTLLKYNCFKGLEKFIKNSEIQAYSYKNEAEKFKFTFIINIYISFLADLIGSNGRLDKMLSVNKIYFFDFDNGFKINDLIKKIDLINHYENVVFSKNKTSADNFESIKEFLNFLIKTNVDDSEYIYFDSNVLKINIKDDFDSFKRVMELYNSSVIIRPYLNFYWNNISSGEKALLNIYSRFYALSDGQKFGQKLSKHLLILIDEGDLYLHPAWQKRFVKNLIDFLPVIFKPLEDNNTRTLQIIFTTNSPIPASDLLSYNTIFLENSFDNNNQPITIIKDSLNDQKQTFASNIHTLLSDSFFVKDGLIGDFASAKINEIIEILVKRIEISRVDSENMKKLIHQIGEPVIKTKLMQLYNDRFNMDIHIRLDNIEKRLDNL